MGSNLYPLCLISYLPSQLCDVCVSLLSEGHQQSIFKQRSSFWWTTLGCQGTFEHSLPWCSEEVMSTDSNKYWAKRLKILKENTCCHKIIPVPDNSVTVKGRVCVCGGGTSSHQCLHSSCVFLCSQRRRINLMGYLKVWLQSMACCQERRSNQSWSTPNYLWMSSGRWVTFNRHVPNWVYTHVHTLCVNCNNGTCVFLQFLLKAPNHNLFFMRFYLQQHPIFPADRFGTLVTSIKMATWTEMSLRW